MLFRLLVFLIPIYLHGPPVEAIETFTCNFNILSLECVYSNIVVTDCNAFFTHSTIKPLVKKVRFVNSTISRLCSNICLEFPTLKVLEIENVGLTSIDEHVFNHCNNLKKLSLFRNLLSTLPPNIFKGLPQLEELNIGFNRWRCLNKDWFCHLTNLREFSACCSPIKNFPSTLLKDATHLETLTLNNNMLSDLRAEKIVMNHPKLHKVAYNGNDFTCLRVIEINKVFRDHHVSVDNFTDPTVRSRFAPILSAEGIECFSDWAWAPNNYVKEFMPVYPNLCNLRASLTEL